MWQKPWSSGAGTKVDGSSPWVRLGSQCRTLQHPCSCARLRLSPLTGQKACPVLIFPVLVTESVCGSWTWGGAGQRSKSPSGHPSLLHPEFSPSSSLLPPESWFRAIHISQSPPARSALCSDPACHHLSERFLGYRRDLLPALPPLLWLSPLLLHTAAWVKVWLHSPFTAFLLSFWANSNHHHHNYTDSTLDQGLETGWSYKSSFTREGFWTCSGRHWDPHKDDVGRRYVFALPASITLSEPTEWLAFKLLCFPVVSAMLAATTGPLHMLFEYLKTTDLFAVSSCLASHWLA